MIDYGLRTPSTALPAASVAPVTVCATVGLTGATALPTASPVPRTVSPTGVVVFRAPGPAGGALGAAAEVEADEGAAAAGAEEVGRGALAPAGRGGRSLVAASVAARMWRGGRGGGRAGGGGGGRGGGGG